MDWHKTVKIKRSDAQTNRNKMSENDFSNENLSEVRIEGVREISPGVYIIWFPRKFDFIAGQVIGITNSVTTPNRLYSIASGEHEPEVRILFDVKDGGQLTPRLASLKKGDVILTTGPAGEFTCEPGPAYWIAAGTGIAPFASMFYSGLWENKVLIHGERTLDRFYFEEDFRPVLNGDYIRCCSMEKGNGVYEGRLTGYLRECKLLPDDRKYYLCGSAEMVVQTRDLLLSEGISFDNIVAEIYF